MARDAYCSSRRTSKVPKTPKIVTHRLIMPVVVAALSRSNAARRPTNNTVKIKSSTLDNVLEGLPEESERLGEGYVDKKVLQKDGSSRWVRVCENTGYKCTCIQFASPDVSCHTMSRSRNQVVHLTFVVFTHPLPVAFLRLGIPMTPGAEMGSV